MKLTNWLIVGLVLISGCIGSKVSETTTVKPTETTLRSVTGTGETSSLPIPTTIAEPTIKFTVLNDKDCIICDTSEIVTITKMQLFPTVEIEEVDISSKRGQQLLKDLDIQALPAYIFDKNVENSANFSRIQDALITKGDRYIIHPVASRAGKYLNPPGEDDDPVKGDANAPVTIIEFSDFECPFCGKFFSETLPKIEKEYIDAGKVKLVYRDFPLSFHKNAQKAAEAAECADDQRKFWEYHDKLFENQQALDVTSLKKYATDLGLDAEAFNDCLDSDKYADEVNADWEDGSNNGGVSGTPTFFINGAKVVGALVFEGFKPVIDAELEK